MTKILLLTTLLILSVTTNSSIIEKEIIREPEEISIEPELTLRNVYDKMIEIGIKHPDIVINQVRHETGNLDRILNNNLLGFRHNKYIHYDSWVDSIIYLKKWQDKFYHGGDYYNFLTKLPYAEDPEYVVILKGYQKFINTEYYN